MSNGEKNLFEALLAKNVTRSKTGRIRERFAEIEEAQQQGIRNIDIVNALNAEGLDLTLKTFENILHRIRKERTDKKEVIHAPINKEKKPLSSTKNDEVSPKSRLNNGILNEYLSTCFNNRSIAEKALDNQVSIETIKSWGCANFVQLSNALSKYLRNKGK
ncbi:hypothetical protein A4O59_004296 [Salmonella enterica subsp. enterica]|nr:hypothetical protein [Salmonella enterica subsp. enterica]